MDPVYRMMGKIHVLAQRVLTIRNTPIANTGEELNAEGVKCLLHWVASAAGYPMQCASTKRNPEGVQYCMCIKKEAISDMRPPLYQVHVERLVQRLTNHSVQ